MKFQLDKRDNLTIFKLEERRLDTTVASALKSEFIVLTQADDILNLLVDLSAVEFADSSGLGALLVAHRSVTSQGGLFGLVAAQPAVEQLIGISQLDRVILMYDTMDDAIADFEIMMEDEDKSDDPFYDEDLDEYQSGRGGFAESKRVGGADEQDDDFDADFEDELGDEASDDFFDDNYDDEK